MVEQATGAGATAQIAQDRLMSFIRRGLEIGGDRGQRKSRSLSCKCRCFRGGRGKNKALTNADEASSAFVKGSAGTLEGAKT